MKYLFFLWLLSLSLYSTIQAQELISLSAVDAISGSTFSLNEASYSQGFVLIFHSTNCPFAEMYANRIKELSENYGNKGFLFSLINPEMEGKEAPAEELKKFMSGSGLNISYLMDDGQVWTKTLQVKKVPEVILVVKGENGPEIAYRGAIDNNPQAEGSVSERFLERAINQILKGEKPTPNQVRAVGCNIRTY